MRRRSGVWKSTDRYDLQHVVTLACTGMERPSQRSWRGTQESREVVGGCNEGDVGDASMRQQRLEGGRPRRIGLGKTHREELDKWRDEGHHRDTERLQRSDINSFRQRLGETKARGVEIADSK